MTWQFKNMFTSYNTAAVDSVILAFFVSTYLFLIFCRSRRPKDKKIKIGNHKTLVFKKLFIKWIINLQLGQKQNWLKFSFLIE